MPKKKFSDFSPGRTIIFSMLAAIALGTFLLSLPAMRTTSMSVIDLLFTATSITCVTGLQTVPLTNFTPLGQFIVLILMQIGGLGLITLTIFILSIFVQLGMTTQLLAGQILELESWKNIKNLLFFIIQLTLFFEGIGALITFFIIKHEFAGLQAVFYAIFHAVSSFCDAGFCLFPDGMIRYNHNPFMLISTSMLMLFGGLGFITWHELSEYIKARCSQKRMHLSLYSKIVLSTSTIIIISTAVIYWMLERHNTFAEMSPFIALCNTLFNAIASRSTGFITIPVGELQIATLFMVMLVAFIGSAPGSTGSGIKTTTFAIFLATIKSAVTEKNFVQIKGRRIAQDQVFKTLAIIAISLGWILLTIFCLLITERNFDFFEIAFEVVSAFATLGISTGITPYLSLSGKLFIIVTMIIGRIGSLTVMLALWKKPEMQEFKYPEERVML
ncbi:MAG: TrkH family potassium uptake protein [Candidatus Babeliales bacterium]